MALRRVLIDIGAISNKLRDSLCVCLRRRYLLLSIISKSLELTVVLRKIILFFKVKAYIFSNINVLGNSKGTYI